MKNFFSLYYIFTHTCHKNYGFKHYVEEGNKEAAGLCSLKTFFSENGNTQEHMCGPALF